MFQKVSSFIIPNYEHSRKIQKILENIKKSLKVLEIDQIHDKNSRQGILEKFQNFLQNNY